MKSSMPLIVGIFITSISQTASAQSWVITGNGNTTTSSKLGTTNAIPLRLFTNNSERMRINATGKVGIGISTPLNILTVKSSGGTPAASWLNGLGSPVFIGFANDMSSEFMLADASNALSQRSVFQGRKSRGTLTTPLAVVNNDYLTSLIASGYDGSTFQNPALVSFFVDGVPSAGNVPARISLVTGSNAANRLERLKVGSTGNFNFNNNQLTIIQATGNVGIGTADNDYRVNIFSNTVEKNNNTHVLKLSGRNPLVGFYDESNNGYGYIKSWTNAPSEPFSKGMVVGSNPGYPIFFSTNYGVTMTIANNNNVGIGTTNPTHKLSVNGTVQAKEVRVESGWSDYVFEKDYQLRSLENVAEYVEKNKHLPGISSAKEIQKNGLPVAEMQTKMMEKIEEMTLYVIQLNDKIKLLEKEINELKKEKK